MKPSWTAIFALLLMSPAVAQAPYGAEDLLTAAGLTPRSTVADAERLYGKDWRKMGAGGIEYMAAGSLADAWMTFRPGHAVYVDCGVAPASLPDDVIARLCDTAKAPDWRQSLRQLRQMLSRGRPTPGLQARLSADNLSAAELAGPDAGKRDADDDGEAAEGKFVTLSRTFAGARYTVIVEVAPRITTQDGTSRAAVMVTWKAN
jgi:hypothetical protein